MTASAELTIPNTMEGISLAAARWLEFAAGRGLSDEARDDLALCLEEALTNVHKYGYQGDALQEIWVQMTVNDGSAVIEIADQGVPFDPTAAAPPDLNAPIENRPIGGLGIHLMRSLTDEFSYRRLDGRNVVRLRKLLI